MKRYEPGGRFSSMSTGKLNFPGIWAHLEWEVLELEPGRAVLAWAADENHCFPAGEEWIVHGGMVTTLLDTAMGQATWSLLNDDEVFLTADLRTEFYRPSRPGTLRARGWVVHKTRRITFSGAELYDSEDRLMASARATNMTIGI
ncbi:MAG: PaaI family thioesterase [Actinomycetota bacterium]